MSRDSDDAAAAFVSTGRLPPPDRVDALVEEAHRLFKGNAEGANADVYPSLARMPSDLFGVAVAGVDGALHASGDSAHEFAIMSVSKPFVFALVCDHLGFEAARERLGVNATGLPFNSLGAVEQSRTGATNPMVNAGAIAATSLVPGANLEEKWAFIGEGLARFAGRSLILDDDIYACALASNARNRAIAQLLEARGRIYCDPAEAIDLYTRQCCLQVSAGDLARMAACLADGGVNPLTKQRAASADACKRTLAVMASAGFYEASGDWLYEVGLPGKSGIAGGVVAVAPGKAGLGVFAPRLDDAGNSVKGRLVSRFLSERLGLSLFASQPEG
ncbi:glutaminase A [Methylocella silvestris]|uniref:Glutaminase n=1 Tax=Methylocella silvestris TaxID=199596 RepID=A0A2J7TJV6_METSI|nr:glutaminase A [Methylocella silvestris]PNG27052.1 glutaminase [Methylocella silvestris]